MQLGEGGRRQVLAGKSVDGSKVLTAETGSL